jgi:DegV family protein with EDD domain
MAMRIIADSACDLPKQIVEEYGIEVCPLMVLLDEEENYDGETITPKEVLDGMREGKVYKTSQVPPNIFKERIEKYAKQGDTCIYVGFSSELSGTYQSSVMAKTELVEEYPNFDIELIDTKLAALGLGLTVLKAAQMAKAEKSKEEIVQMVNFYKDHMKSIFTVDDLDYLCRGGRLSKTSALIGGLLNVKPILEVQEGKLVPVEKVRGRSKVIKRMVEMLKTHGVDLSNQVIGISHGDDEVNAKKLIDMIREETDCKDIIVETIGSTIGAHAGPGTLTLFFLNEILPAK